MKNMPLIILIIVFFASMATKASIIEYRGFSRDASSNIVAGNGVEWLMWDVNKGKSIKEALEKYSDAGWMLATDNHIISLFNIFQFGNSDWSTPGYNNTIYYSAPRSEGGLTVHEQFLQLFGITQFTSCTTLSFDCNVLSTDPQSYTNVLYSAAKNATKPYRNAVVSSPHTRVSAGITRKDGGYALLGEHVHTNPYVSFSFQSVALVRPKSVSPVSVSLSSTFSLLALGLITLMYRRR